VREGLPKRQQTDDEIGPIVRLRLASNKRPVNEDLEAMSELTKKLCLRWEDLEIHDKKVFRKYTSRKSGEPKYLQLLVPRSDVDEVLRLCHSGTVGGHFGVRKTLDQVRRKFYWLSWKGDTRRFVRQCAECNTYHRGKLTKQGPLIRNMVY